MDMKTKMLLTTLLIYAIMIGLAAVRIGYGKGYITVAVLPDDWWKFALTHWIE